MSSDLRTLATDLARAEFDPPRYQPHVWAGDQGNRDLARMSRVALIGIPEVTARFEADLGPFIRRIHMIAPDPLRLIEGGLNA